MSSALTLQHLHEVHLLTEEIQPGVPGLISEVEGSACLVPEALAARK